MDINGHISARPTAHRLAAVFGVLLLIYCFVYFFELASFPFSLDEEWAAYRKDPSIWIAQGRWGAFLIEKYVLPQPSIPFLPQMMFGAACAAAFLMILRVVRRDILALSLSDYASFVIFCAFPTWFFIVEFSSNIGAVAIGLLSGTSAIYLAAMASRENWGGLRLVLSLLLASLLGAVAIATYQTLLFYIFCVGVGSFLIRSAWEEGTFDFPYLRNLIVVIASSVALYLVISGIFKYFFDVIEYYTNIFFDTGYFLGQPSSALLKTLDEAIGYYGVSSNVYHSQTWAFPVVLAAGLLALLVDGRHSGTKRIALVAIAVAVLAAPFALNPFYPGFSLGRTMVATAAAAWIICYLGLNSRNRAIQIGASGALVLAIVQIVYLQNKNQASSYFQAKHDLLLATSIYDRLGNSPGFKKGIPYPMAVFGGREFKSAYPVPETSNAAASFFGPFLNNNYRVRAYLRIIGLEGLRPMSDGEMDNVIIRLSTMPIWPAAGSVVLENGNLLVRLSRNPGPTDAASLARAQAKKP